MCICYSGNLYSTRLAHPLECLQCQHDSYADANGETVETSQHHDAYVDFIVHDQFSYTHILVQATAGIYATSPRYSIVTNTQYNISCAYAIISLSMVDPIGKFVVVLPSHQPHSQCLGIFQHCTGPTALFQLHCLIQVWIACLMIDQMCFQQSYQHDLIAFFPYPSRIRRQIELYGYAGFSHCC
jgi:hypothetical protein